MELLDLPLTDARVGQSFVPADRAAVTAWDSTASAMYIGIPADAELTEPVVVGLRGTGGLRGNGHTVLEAGRHSRATVVLEPHRLRASTPATSRSVVGDGAELTVVSVQEWDDDVDPPGPARRAGRPRRPPASTSP